MCEAKLPEWMDTDIHIKKDQYIHRDLISKCWITHPRDATVGDKILFRSGGKHSIESIRWENNDKRFLYHTDEGVATLTVAQIQHDPDVVIV